MIIDNLFTEAVWIIMDPWELTDKNSDEIIKYSNLDRINHIHFKKIKKILSKLKCVCISCPRGVKFYKSLRRCPNMYNSDKRLKKFLKKVKHKNIVYIGYHHGGCILSKPDGAASMQEYYQQNNYTVYIAKDLCCLYPGDIQQYQDDKSSEYAILI